MTVQRATVLLLVLFAIVYASVAGIGGVRHASEAQPPGPTPAPTPISVGIDAWSLTPPFAKEAGLPPTIRVFAGQMVSINVTSPGNDYKLAHFTLVSGQRLAVQPQPQETPASSTITTGNGITVVISKSVTAVGLTCGSSIDCLVSTQ